MPVATDRPLPPSWAPMEAALRGRRPVGVSYHGRYRLICPHVLGWKNHRALAPGPRLPGRETSTGTSDPDPRKRWRCLFVDEIEGVLADHSTSWRNADNYNPERAPSTASTK